MQSKSSTLGFSPLFPFYVKLVLKLHQMIDFSQINLCIINIQIEGQKEINLEVIIYFSK